MNYQQANFKKATANKHTFVAYEETDPLGDKRVRIYSPLWQAGSKWYPPDDIAQGWTEAEAKLPFDFAWVDTTCADAVTLFA